MVLDANTVSNSLGFILIVADFQRQTKFPYTTSIK